MAVTISLFYFIFLVLLGTFIWELKEGNSKNAPVVITIILNIIFLLCALFGFDTLLDKPALLSIFAVSLNTILLLIFNFLPNLKLPFQKLKICFNQ